MYIVQVPSGCFSGVWSDPDLILHFISVQTIAFHSLDYSTALSVPAWLCLVENNSSHLNSEAKLELYSTWIEEHLGNSKCCSMGSYTDAAERQVDSQSAPPGGCKA